MFSDKFDFFIHVIPKRYDFLEQNNTEIKNRVHQNHIGR